MSLLTEFAPWLVAMGVLVLASAFFSSSEAALFSLRREDLRTLAGGSRGGRIAVRLLGEPDRLLTAVLFWNLVVNLAYFTIVSITSLRLEHEGRAAEAASFAVIALLVLIVLSEMLPKTLAVLHPRGLATLEAIPLAAAVRLVDPMLPALRAVNRVSRRVLAPRFQAEPYLQVSDLERAVELSGGDATLVEQEQTVLQNIVSLSETRADELMRPRTQFAAFRPPVSLKDLHGSITPSGYLVVTEPDSDEVAGAVSLKELSNLPGEDLQNHAEPVVYVPWCATVSQVLEAMQTQDRHVAAVVNELGETIGILTFSDIVDTIFTRSPSRVRRLLRRVPIRQVAPGRWQVTGMTGVRRLARYFNVVLPPTHSVTVAGVVQECLERFPEVGDRCAWGPFELKVVEMPDRDQLVVELILVPETEGPQP